jgi:ferredoxin
MRAVVDCGLCIACGLCEDSCPDVFRVDDDCALVLSESPARELYADIRDAAEVCPTSAISLVAETP